MTKQRMPLPTKSKEAMRKKALATGRKVLWLDDKGFWHASTDLQNTPHYAVQVEELKDDPA